jgi:hypothetical protein
MAQFKSNTLWEITEQDAEQLWDTLDSESEQQSYQTQDGRITVEYDHRIITSPENFDPERENRSPVPVVIRVSTNNEPKRWRQDIANLLAVRDYIHDIFHVEFVEQNAGKYFAYARL